MHHAIRLRLAPPSARTVALQSVRLLAARVVVGRGGGGRRRSIGRRDQQLERPQGTLHLALHGDLPSERVAELQEVVVDGCRSTIVSPLTPSTFE